MMPWLAESSLSVQVKIERAAYRTRQGTGAQWKLSLDRLHPEQSEICFPRSATFL
jgi:hypothetical protein